MEEKPDQIAEAIEAIIETGDMSALGGVLEGLRAPDCADVISALPGESWEIVFRVLQPETASEVLTLVDEGIARNILETLSVDEVVPLIEFMASDDATDIINLLPETNVPLVLHKISREDYEDVSELLKFDEESAGGLMERELVTVMTGMKISDVIGVVRTVGEKIKHIQNIFVIDRSKRLQGSIPVIELLIEDPDKRVEDVMDRDFLTVTAETDQEEVAALFSKYDLYSLPVVDSSGVLAGRITVDDIIDVIEEEANEDITMMAGTGEEEFWERSPVRLSRARLPWLLTGLFGGIASAMVMNSFKDSLESIIALAFFVPVIMAMGGNVGIQSSAIVVRELAVGGLSISNTGGKLLRELKVSLINGIVLGSVLLVMVMLWQQNVRLGMLLGLCMFIIICWATMMGVLIPLLLKRANIDPALATGPFITTVNDIVGILVYLGIATIFLNWIGTG
ncbi:MAG: magnesium transporter [Candidatus Krumholzibacteria bacterium]|nr:magnesium transporter [Candidatus Krumholzibacteria bacterium]